LSAYLTVKVVEHGAHLSGTAGHLLLKVSISLADVSSLLDELALDEPDALPPALKAKIEAITGACLLKACRTAAKFNQEAEGKPGWRGCIRTSV
jgi:hypothetical protein